VRTSLCSQSAVRGASWVIKLFFEFIDGIQLSRFHASF
jgi:hypothetical protein